MVPYTQCSYYNAIVYILSFIKTATQSEYVCKFSITVHICHQNFVILYSYSHIYILLITVYLFVYGVIKVIKKLLVKQANTRTLRSNTKNLLQIPLTNLKRFGDRAFCAYAPRLWNELPDNIKAADSVQNFKKQLKTLLFRKEFNMDHDNCPMTLKRF